MMQSYLFFLPDSDKKGNYIHNSTFFVVSHCISLSSSLSHRADAVLRGKELPRCDGCQTHFSFPRSRLLIWGYWDATSPRSMQRT